MRCLAFGMASVLCVVALGCGSDDSGSSSGGSSASAGSGGAGGTGATGGSGGAGAGGEAGTAGTGATGGSGGSGGGTSGSGGSTGGSGGAGGSNGGSGGSGGTGGTGGGSVGCAPLPAPDPGSNIIDVSPADVGNLSGIVSSATTGDTIRFASGTYDLNGAYLWVSAPGVTLRSASGNRDDVVLNGNYQSTEIITIAASNVTVADLTIREAYTHPIHVVTNNADTLNTLIYNVHIIDPREQAIKVNPNQDGVYVDDGEVACSHIELTDAGRPHVQPNPGGCYTGGFDGHQARGWVLRDNIIEGFWCDTGLSEHAVHCWRGCRDTVVERNYLLNNARGVGFGLSNSGDARTYSDNPCPAAGGAYVGHYDGIVRNNFIFANDPGLLASPSGFDCGICFWSACGAQAVHNTIASTGDNFSSIEWRFSSSTGVEILNNIATHPLRERDGASGSQDGNLESAQLSLFVDGQNGNLHLASGAAAAIDQGATVPAGICEDDIDGDARGASPDIGADEVP